MAQKGFTWTHIGLDVTFTVQLVHSSGQQWDFHLTFLKIWQIEAVNLVRLLKTCACPELDNIKSWPHQTKKNHPSIGTTVGPVPGRHLFLLLNARGHTRSIQALVWNPQCTLDCARVCFITQEFSSSTIRGRMWNFSGKYLDSEKNGAKIRSTKISQNEHLWFQTLVYVTFKRWNTNICENQTPDMQRENHKASFVVCLALFQIQIQIHSQSI